jgi:hypothetical protein
MRHSDILRTQKTSKRRARIYGGRSGNRDHAQIKVPLKHGQRHRQHMRARADRASATLDRSEQRLALPPGGNRSRNATKVRLALQSHGLFGSKMKVQDTAYKIRRLALTVGRYLERQNCQRRGFRSAPPRVVNPRFRDCSDLDSAVRPVDGLLGVGAGDLETTREGTRPNASRTGKPITHVPLNTRKGVVSAAATRRGLTVTRGDKMRCRQRHRFAALGCCACPAPAPAGSSPGSHAAV